MRLSSISATEFSYLNLLSILLPFLILSSCVYPPQNLRVYMNEYYSASALSSLLLQGEANKPTTIYLNNKS